MLLFLGTALVLFVFLAHAVHLDGLGEEHVHGSRQVTDLVLLLGELDLDRLVAFGQALHVARDVGKRLGDAAADDHRTADHDQQNDQGDTADDGQDLHENGVDVVDVNTGPDDPLPILVVRNITDLVDRMIRADLRPLVGKEAGTGRVRD